jgi:hypothetical protein
MPSSKASDVVRKAQDKNREAGGGRLTFNLSPDEMAEWEALLAKIPEGRGQQKAALMMAIRAGRRKNGPTKSEVLAAIETHWED